MNELEYNKHTLVTHTQGKPKWINTKDGRKLYELFYPYIKDEKKVILYFSDYQRYGKIGS